MIQVQVHIYRVSTIYSNIVIGHNMHYRGCVIDIQLIVILAISAIPVYIAILVYSDIPVYSAIPVYCTISVYSAISESLIGKVQPSVV